MPEILASLMSQPWNVRQLGRLGVFAHSKNEPAVFAHVPTKHVLTEIIKSATGDLKECGFERLCVMKKKNVGSKHSVSRVAHYSSTACSASRVYSARPSDTAASTVASVPPAAASSFLHNYSFRPSAVVQKRAEQIYQQQRTEECAKNCASQSAAAVLPGAGGSRASTCPDCLY